MQLNFNNFHEFSIFSINHSRNIQCERCCVTHFTALLNRKKTKKQNKKKNEDNDNKATRAKNGMIDICRQF